VISDGEHSATGVWLIESLSPSFVGLPVSA
jgi:hypothetical protein